MYPSNTFKLKINDKFAYINIHNNNYVIHIRGD